ncbi:MAG: peptidylprolyl isomerase [Pseudomonadota bacterium]
MLHDPLVHFLLIGMLVAVLGEWRTPSPNQPSIHLSADTVETMALALATEHRGGVSDQALRDAVHRRIDELVLYREALALGLDDDDLVVRRRMAQKMATLLESLEEVRSPTPEALAAWYETHAARYQRAARYTVDHLYIAGGEDASRMRAAALGLRVAGQPLSALDRSLGDPFLDGPTITGATARRLELLLGEDAARQVRELTPGSWSVPIRSVHGWHLFWVVEVQAASAPALASIETRVLADYLAQAREIAREQALEELRARYHISVEWPAAALAEVAP